MANDKDSQTLHNNKYWDERYTSEKVSQSSGGTELHTYEWYRNFDQLRPLLISKLPPCSSGCHILHLGCGNSSLTADLHALGYKNQTSIDFSSVVIAAMSSKFSDLDTTWAVMDVRALQLPDASVDVAIDKGTLDSMVDKCSWDPPADVRASIAKYVEEVARVLKPGGLWICISYQQAHFVRRFVEREELWDLEVHALTDSQGAGAFGYLGFVMKKF